MSSANLTVENINFKYDSNDDWALHVDKLNLTTGVVTCIVGPNGSGKSTLLRIASGILKPSAGTVTLDDNDIHSMSRRTIARTMGYLPQESPTLYDYTVDDVIQMGRYAHQKGLVAVNSNDADIVSAAIKTVGLAKYHNRILSHLSGGERRRALIASVLAQQPQLMLLDEPTSGLDIHHASGIFKLLSSLAQAGPGIVIVTHDINLASLFCDRIIILKNGAIKADGTPNEIITTDIMQSLYGHEILIQQHPEIDRPVVLPATGSKRERAVPPAPDPTRERAVPPALGLCDSCTPRRANNET